MHEPAEDVVRFIAERIDTVPELEALLLFWEQRPTSMTVKEIASRLFVPRGVAAAVIRALVRRRLVVQIEGDTKYAYDSAWEPNEEFMSRVAATYRRNLIRVTTLIHSKAPTAVLEFARAFEPRKDT
jgi:hypothetical protein